MRHIPIVRRIPVAYVTDKFKDQLWAFFHQNFACENIEYLFYWAAEVVTFEQSLKKVRWFVGNTYVHFSMKVHFHLLAPCGEDSSREALGRGWN